MSASTALNMHQAHKPEAEPTHPDVGELHPRPVGVHHHPGVGGEVAPAPRRPGVEVQVVLFLPDALDPAGRHWREAATSHTHTEAEPLRVLTLCRRTTALPLRSRSPPGLRLTHEDWRHHTNASFVPLVTVALVTFQQLFWTLMNLRWLKSSLLCYTVALVHKF